MDEKNTNMISTSKEQRKSAHTSREYSEPDLIAAARIQHEKEMDELKNEKAVLTKKLRAIKKYEVQSACMKVELGKFRALALNPSLFAVYSEPIHLAGFEWKLCAERSFDNCLGLFLCIYVPDPSTKEWECQVNFTFCIKHTTDMDACIHRGNMRPVVFSQVLGRCGRSGYPDIIGIHHLLDPQSGFVDLQDCIQMGVSFSVLYSTLA